jgi:hypothetical protein
VKILMVYGMVDTVEPPNTHRCLGRGKFVDKVTLSNMIFLFYLGRKETIFSVIYSCLLALSMDCEIIIPE